MTRHHTRTGVKIPCILNSSTWSKLVVRFMFKTLYLWRKNSGYSVGMEVIGPQSQYEYHGKPKNSWTWLLPQFLLFLITSILQTCLSIFLTDLYFMRYHQYCKVIFSATHLLIMHKFLQKCVIHTFTCILWIRRVVSMKKMCGINIKNY